VKYFVLQSRNDEPLTTFIFISAILHISFFLLMAVKNVLLPSHIIEVPESIRVDVVALPDKIDDTPSPKAENSEPVALNQPTKPEPAKANLKDSQKKALEKLKALSAIEKFKEELKASPTPQKLKATPKPNYKGNVISSGNSFTGLTRLKANEYLSDLTTRVRERWVLPQWLSDANLKASVVMAIDGRGQIVRKEIAVSSGNSIFDSSCLAAVADAAPFAPPPEEFEDALFMIRFPFE
jgi:TonB family protein